MNTPRLLLQKRMEKVKTADYFSVQSLNWGSVINIKI